MSILNGTFSMLEHLDKLEPKGRNTYICPVCGDDNLKVNPKTGAYQCFSTGCEPRAIRDAIAPLTPGAKEAYTREKTRPKTKKERDRAVTLSTVEIEVKVDELVTEIAAGYETPEQAQVKLSTWAKSEGHDVFAASQLLRAKIRELKRSAPELDTDNENKLLKNYDRIKRFFGKRLRYNELFKQVELDSKILPLSMAKIEFVVTHGANITGSREDVADIALKLAKDNTYSPVVEYLSQVHATHGGSTILEGMASRYFGATEPIHQIVLKRFLIAAVARAMEPGCKCDTALILQGEQGCKKSSFFSELASIDWFDDSLGNSSDKDERLKLHRVWFVEWAELETKFSRKDISEVKAFMTSRIDLIRPPYGRETEPMKRASVIVGTTNEWEFLTDSTGNRRFWIIPVTKVIPIDQLKQERDRIWAAAVTLYRQGFVWWLTDEEEALMNESRAQYHNEDPWYDLIASRLELHPEITVEWILDEVLKLEPGQRDRSKQKRVAAILRRLGRTPVSNPVWRDGRKLRVWVKK